jgi:hypothetical protein
VGLATCWRDIGSRTQQVVTPAVLFGIPVSGSAAAPEASGGANTLCTEMALARSSGEWRCLGWTINIHHAAVRKPRPYDGECAHATVDQTRGAWTCLGGNAVPDDELPPQ